MKFKAEHYFRAGQERIKQARAIYREGESYALAMYCSGLAVECVLRAFAWEREGGFVGRHDLEKLFGASRILQIADEARLTKELSQEVIEKLVIELRGAMNTVVVLWHNDFRFASESQVRSFLVSMHEFKRVKGDLLKAKAYELLEACQVLIDKGVALWTLRKK